MYEFKLPDVGEGIHEAEILRWLVNIGDTIEANQPILEIQTDKAVVEIPSPVSGTIAVFTYTLDAVGNRLSMYDLDGLTSYGYDDLYRLTQVSYPDHHRHCRRTKRAGSEANK